VRLRLGSQALPCLLATLVGAGPGLAAEASRHWLVSVSDVVVSEESCAPHEAVFTVRLSKRVQNLPPQVVTVEYATADGTAVGGVDYAPASGSLTLTPPNPVLTVVVPVTDAMVPGPDKTFTLNLSNATGAIIAKPTGTATLHAPTVAKCASCGLSCDGGDVCNHDSCDAIVGCRHVPLEACSEPGSPAVCSVPTQCSAADSDGDGLGDAWEAQGGIDFDCDGDLTADETVLTNVDILFPDGSPNPYPSADPATKDVFVLYDWMELPDQLTGGGPTTCTVDPLPPPGNIFYPFHSDDCAFDELCMGGFCKGHSDEPDPATLKAVIDAFAARGVRLHLLPGHALAHANVVSYGPPVPACIADLAGEAFLGEHAVNFYDLKTANMAASYNGRSFDESELLPIFHYAVFGHRHTCDSIGDCAKAACVVDGVNQPQFNETGYAEPPGNDLVVSLGGAFRDRNIDPPALTQSGTFMHELGHNLGLAHGGPLKIGGVPQDIAQLLLNYKPNYLSVMNYNHMTRGIGTADAGCAPDDYACKTTAVSTRLDYSSFEGGTTPNVLDETNGTEAAGLNLGNQDIGYTWCAGAQTPIPGTGPVDFNCFGGSSESWCGSGCDITPALELNHDPFGQGTVGGDQLQPFEDWPNLTVAYLFEAAYNDGPDPIALVP
jgi:hypothetical protein